MNITYLSSARLPSRAANGIQIMKMCESFARQGNHLTLLCVRTGNAAAAFEFYGVERSFNIRELTQPDFRGSIYWYAVKAAAVARRTRPDLVYARCLPSAFFAARLGLSVILEIHTDIRDYGGKCERMFRWLKDAPNLARIVVISHALGRRLRERYGVDPELVVVAPDAASPTAEPSVRPAGSCDALRIGYTGHLYRGRGLDLIVELAGRLPWAQFHVVGGEPEDAADWRSRCAGLPNLVFHGFVDPARIDALRADFDVLIAPYQRVLATQGGGADTVRWMSPLKIFEYMAAGRPIVASRLPALEEVLEDGRNALLCEPDDVDDWVRALEGLRRDPSLRQRIAEQARRDFENNYTWERRAERVLAGH